MAYPLKSTWGSFNNPQFNQLHSQIQQQTQALLRQRDNLTTNFSYNQPYLKQVQSQKFIKLNSDRSTNQNHEYVNSKKNVTDKVRELIDLCKNQNSSFGNQLVKVLNDEKNIYNDLIGSGKNSSQKTQYFGVSNPILEVQKQSSVVQGSREQQISNLASKEQSPTKGNVFPKSSIREAIQKNSKIQVGDDLIQMIQQIERKALNEIQKLRQQKIDLMKQLKQQIQSNNQLQKELNSTYSQKNPSQKIISQNNIQGNYTPYKQFNQIISPQQRNPLQQQILGQIRVEMDNLRKDNQNLRANLNTNKNSTGQFYYPQSSQGNEVLSLRNKAAILENQLRGRDQLINQLTAEINRLNQQSGYASSNPHQISQLLQQGQAIRQNTLHLIRMKEGQKGGFSNQQQRIQELEQLLQRQQEQKQSFLNDLLAFKQKYQQLEEQNRILKRQSKPMSSDLTKLSPILQKSSSNNYNVGASLDQYEKILSQMRGKGY